MNNFNSIHILNSDMDAALFWVGQCQSNSKYSDELRHEFDVFAKDIKKKKKKLNDLERMKEVMKFILEHGTQEHFATFYFLENTNGTISVFSDLFEFSTLIDYASSWFWPDMRESSPDVLAVRSFDESVLEIALLCNGSPVTSYVTGDGAEEYGLTNKKFDEAIICEKFNITKEQLYSAYDDDASDALDNFSQLFGLPLNKNESLLLCEGAENLTKEVFEIGFVW